MILIQIIDLYSLIVLVAVVMSWLQLPASNPIAQFVHLATEPVLGPMRRVLPQTGGLDFSPMILLFGLQMLKNMLF
jgi:YggT family protein